MTGSDYLKSGNIEDEIMSREWTLNDVLDMDKTVADIVQKLITGMDIESKYDIVKDIKVEAAIIDSFPVGEIISRVLRQELKDMVGFVVNNYLKTAKVEFNEENSNKIYEEPMEELKEKLGRDEVIVKEDVKVLTLKERIRADTKQLSEEEKKKAGLI
jgi:hypothetical protein